MTFEYHEVAEHELDKIRLERERFLHEADIEILKLEDAGLDTSAWRTYRQVLRDITKNSTFAHLVQWPAHPGM
tara:strand:- start:89 stop:307 length:219 start_codon:yes stop_codon:yes gene_type:complete